MTYPSISLHRVSKTFFRPNSPTTQASGCQALRSVSFQILPGERVALLGASGSGKSTLIRLLCGLEAPDTNQGEILIEGVPLFRAGCRASRSAFGHARAATGVIFQQFNLVGQLSVLENVLVGQCASLPIWRAIGRNFSRDARAIALDCLEKVGLADKADQRASTLSGGQQQRVAVARALAKGSRIILADEPVASLDPASSRRVMKILCDLAAQFGITLLVSLHQTEVAKQFCSRVIALRQGELVLDSPTTELSETVLRNLYGVNAEELLTTSSGGFDVVDSEVLSVA